MSTSSVNAVKIAHTLDDYMISNFWSGSTAEYSQVIPLQLIQINPIAYTWSFGAGNISLPTSGIDKWFYIYMVPKTALQGIQLDTSNLIANNENIPNDNDWISIETLLPLIGPLVNGVPLTDSVEIRLFTNMGKILNRKGVYVLAPFNSDLIYIAVAANMMQLYDERPTELNFLYLSYYQDSDDTKDIYVKSWYDKKGTASISANDIYNATLPTICIRNGVIQSIHVNDIRHTSSNVSIDSTYVETIYDGNIHTVFDIPLTSCPTYTSKKRTPSGETAYLIHVPIQYSKDESDRRYVTTYKTCDIVLVDDNNQGWLYNKQYNNETSVWQLTHNDFAIPKQVVDDYVTAFNVTKIRILIRRHNYAIYMPNDANYINKLYSHSDDILDDTVIQFLTGTHPDSDTLYFWKAEHLESSKYIDFLMQYDYVPEAGDITNYVKALGYYHTLAILAKTVHRETATAISGAVTLRFNIPVLLDVNTFEPIVFKNTTQLSNMQYTLSFTDQEIIIDITGITEPDEQFYTVLLFSSPDESTAAQLYEIEITPNNEIIIDTILSDGDIWVGGRVMPWDSDVTQLPNDIFNNTVYKHVNILDYFTIQDDGYKTTFSMYPSTDSEHPLPGYRGIHTSVDDVDSPDHGDWMRIDGTNEVWVYRADLDTWVDQNDTTYTYKFIISNSNFHKEYAFDVDTMISNEDLLKTDLTATYTKVSDSTPITHPWLNNLIPLHFINDKFQTPELISNIVERTIHNDWWSRRFYITQTAESALTGNTSQLMFQPGSSGNLQYGYITPETPSGISALLMWYPELTLVLVDGYVLANVAAEAATFDLTSIGAGNGQIVSSLTMIPAAAENMLLGYNKSDDLNRIKLIQTYFKNFYASSDSDILILVPKVTDIYSIYMHILVWLATQIDPVSGEPLQADLDALDTNLTDYAFIKDFDIAYSDVANWQFIDVFPSYCQWSIQSTTLWAKIQELILGVYPILADKDLFGVFVANNT